MERDIQRVASGLLSSAERWAPAEAERWARWRESLSSERRANALLPLQAALSGLDAFRHLENHPPSFVGTDFGPSLRAVHVTYGWALELARQLGEPAGATSPPVAVEAISPDRSLAALRRSLSDAEQVSERLLELPVVDVGAFEASCDLFLRDLDRNTFFRPPEPLEFANVNELIRAESLTPALESWKSDAAKMATSIALLTLVRSHRFLSIAEGRVYTRDGIYCTHVVAAAVRRELRTLTRFLLVQGVETLASEFEARLLSLDAHHVTKARRQITEASRQLKGLRESVESLAVSVQARAGSALDVALPAHELERAFPLECEPLSTGIREVQAMVKHAARELRTLTRLGPTESEPRPDGAERHGDEPPEDVWAFRFILRAFIAKASVTPVHTDDWSTLDELEFVSEFVRHYRVFAPRLLRRTPYARRGPLARAIDDLAKPSTIDSLGLERAARECRIFVEHLDATFEEIESNPAIAAFDKQRAARELRSYLRASKERRVSERVPAGAFGEAKPDRARAS